MTRVDIAIVFTAVILVAALPAVLMAGVLLICALAWLADQLWRGELPPPQEESES